MSPDGQFSLNNLQRFAIVVCFGINSYLCAKN